LFYPFFDLLVFQFHPRSFYCIYFFLSSFGPFFYCYFLVLFYLSSFNFVPQCLILFFYLIWVLILLITIFYFFLNLFCFSIYFLIIFFHLVIIPYLVYIIWILNSFVIRNFTLLFFCVCLSTR